MSFVDGVNVKMEMCFFQKKKKQRIHHEKNSKPNAKYFTNLLSLKQRLQENGANAPSIFESHFAYCRAEYDFAHKKKKDLHGNNSAPPPSREKTVNSLEELKNTNGIRPQVDDVLSPRSEGRLRLMEENHLKLISKRVQMGCEYYL